jgi:two-component system, OmpR family, sensor histidine kinase BaeS
LHAFLNSISRNRTLAVRKEIERGQRLMKLKFRQKVFLTFLLNSIAIVVCMLAVAGFFADRNFEAYLDKVEMAKLGELAEILSREYQANGSWEPVLDKWRNWLNEMGSERSRGAVDSTKPPSPLSSFLVIPREDRHRPGDRSSPYVEPPPPPPPPPPAIIPPEPRFVEPRLSLLDAGRRLMAGSEPSPPDAYRLEPIKADGQTIGWLGIEKFVRKKHPLDVEFLMHQSRTFYSVGGIALLLATLVTLALSRHLLAPLKELASGTRALTRRKFETRLMVRTEDEFGQLAADFNNMAGALGRYEQMRRQWIADISHELRTPLAILRGEIEAMQDGVREVTPEALDSLHFEVLHVSRIVHDLHDLSLIESGSIEAEQTSVNPLDVLDETVKSFQTRFAQRGISIKANGGRHLEIPADSDRLKQLFSNLLENALRYVDSPGALKIGHEISPDHLLLHFEDSGPGVPEESLGRLFDRLYRVDKARSRAQGGSGLGLAICKGIVESFGGWIEASNAAGGGLRITVAFPLKPETQKREAFI